MGINNGPESIWFPARDVHRFLIDSVTNGKSRKI